MTHRFPNLRHLGLLGAPNGDDLVAELVRLPLLGSEPRVRRRCCATPHLSLVLEQTQIPRAMVRDLAALPFADVGRQDVYDC